MTTVSEERLSRHPGFADTLRSGNDKRVGDSVSSYFRRKATIDQVAAVLLLIPALPLIGLLVLLVRLTSRGPGIYRQARVGKNGRNFMVYKIRTMTNDAESGTGAIWTRPNDSRITPVGNLLRKLHLDEFPQLFNVLRGEMALVGPRPERPEFVHVLTKRIPGYLNRLAVLPGVTGLAQINLPPDTDIESVRKKLVLDLEYCKTAGMFLDLRMILCTVFRLLGLSGERAMRLMLLRREVGESVDAHLALDLPTPASLMAARDTDRTGSHARLDVEECCELG
ncbi:MAG: sugar transferase [Candidatus Nealsonbacteria bacterium]|nr:sugar transferase [Candidatus Nealsonbacteria bacterium]